jgi:guanylate kinase
MIVTLTGVSATGKTTIEKNLRARFDNLKPVISHTTRPPGEGDLLGNYAHLSEEEFKRMEDAGEFIWAVYIFGNHYGTAFKSLEDTIPEPDTIFLMVLEPDSIKKLRNFSEKINIKVVSFYILSPPPEVLRERLWNRGRETAGLIERRIIEAALWDERAKNSGIPYIFVRNDGEVHEAVDEVVRAIELYRRLPSKIDF